MILDGFSEELKEFTWSLGAEFMYDDSFALRAGYFNENELKGARKFFTLGAGFKYNVIDVDLSYLISDNLEACAKPKSLGICAC